MLSAAICTAAWTADEVPDEPGQPDRPAPVPLGFRPLPELDLQEEAVVVEGFRLLPLSDASGWQFHPKALAGLAWDTNPLQAQSGSDGDVQERLAIGFEARGEGVAGWRLDLDAVLRVQHYETTAGRNTTGGSLVARARHDGETARQSLNAAWERSSDPVIDLPEQVDRERLNAEIRTSAAHRNSSWNAGLSWNELDYLEASSYFNETDRDQRALSAIGAWQLNGGSDSLLGVDGSITTVERPETSPANEYTGVTILGRWKHAFGGRSTLDLRLGVDARRHDADTLQNSANDDQDLLSPAASARLLWAWETRSWIHLTASTGLVDGVTTASNAAHRDALELSGRLRLLDRLDLIGLGWYARREDSGAAAGRAIETAIDAYLRMGVDYRLRDGLGLRTWASWQNHSSATSSDYDRLLVALELAAAL